MLHGNLKRSIANQNGFNRLLPDTFFSVQTKEVIDNPLNVHFINVFHDICPVVLFLLTIWLPFDIYVVTVRAVTSATLYDKRGPREGFNE